MIKCPICGNPYRVWSHQISHLESYSRGLETLKEQPEEIKVLKADNEKLESYCRGLEIEHGKLKERLRKAEKVIDEFADKTNWETESTYDEFGYLQRSYEVFYGLNMADSYREEFPKE